MNTYLFGYGTQRMTLLKMRSQPTVIMLDPEFWRRLKLLMQAARRAGHDVGIGGAGRTSAQQEQLFLSRHTVVASGGCCSHAGKRWALKPGQAHAAPPGRSYHEPTTPAGGVLAVDLVGWQDHWVANNCARFGLKHFRDVNGEEWHLQPLELPNARSSYSPAIHHPLPKWKVS